MPKRKTKRKNVKIKAFNLHHNKTQSGTARNNNSDFRFVRCFVVFGVDCFFFLHLIRA
jgi:hypothetical protein